MKEGIKENIMYILSISHKFAPIEIREKFSINEEKQKAFLLGALENPNITECVYLSTCNRTEVYFNGEGNVFLEIEKELAKHTGASISDMKKYFGCFQDESAIIHLYKVASGLDSMLIGEDEILGQLKDAFNFALETGTTKYHLNTLFRGAITCAKNVKTNTMMSKIPLSLGTLVSNLVLDFEKDVVNVMIIGLTGKMGTTILKNLYNKENISIVGTTRKHNNILQYKSDYNGIKMVEYKKRYEYVDNIDIFISVTKSPHYTLTYSDLVGKIDDSQIRIFIDLSVPKDIDIDIEKIENTVVYNVDYFKNIAKTNNDSRVREVENANLIIEEYVEQVLKELYFHDFRNDMNSVKEFFENEKFESVIYKLRDNATSNDLLVLFDNFKKLIE